MIVSYDVISLLHCVGFWVVRGFGVVCLVVGLFGGLFVFGLCLLLLVWLCLIVYLVCFSFWGCGGVCLGLFLFGCLF